MYNGIGLQTPRGSGTNGYIQRNYSYLRQRRTDLPKLGESLKPITGKVPKSQALQPDANLLLHEEKRKIEVRLLQEKEALLTEGHRDEKQIDRMIKSRRERLLKEVELQCALSGVRSGRGGGGLFGSSPVSRVPETRRGIGGSFRGLSAGEDGRMSNTAFKSSHLVAEEKREKLGHVAGALNIDEKSHQVGFAFDFKKQQELKEARKREWEERRKRMVEERRNYLLEMRKKRKREKKLQKRLRKEKKQKKREEEKERKGRVKKMKKEKKSHTSSSSSGSSSSDTSSSSSDSSSSSSISDSSSSDSDESTSSSSSSGSSSDEKQKKRDKKGKLKKELVKREEDSEDERTGARMRGRAGEEENGIEKKGERLRDVEVSERWMHPGPEVHEEEWRCHRRGGGRRREEYETDKRQRSLHDRDDYGAMKRERGDSPREREGSEGHEGYRMTHRGEERRDSGRCKHILDKHISDTGGFAVPLPLRVKRERVDDGDDHDRRNGERSGKRRDRDHNEKTPRLSREEEQVHDEECRTPAMMHRRDNEAREERRNRNEEARQSEREGRQRDREHDEDDWRERRKREERERRDDEEDERERRRDERRKRRREDKEHERRRRRHERREQRREDDDDDDAEEDWGEGLRRRGGEEREDDRERRREEKEDGDRGKEERSWDRRREDSEEAKSDRREHSKRGGVDHHRSRGERGEDDGSSRAEK
ncbi:cwf21 protein [Cystoisospora suis]|uniref:Cwf21 protein n=1 Tax=Cystoisospora suis TaxID=483139 RepID=A0A2C6KWE7_9APIC|nr:cwf21 protein [Cystoisospora suis]